jgi:hypothetical protein
MSMLEATPDTQPASPGRMTAELLRLALQANADCMDRFRRLAAEFAEEGTRGGGDDYEEGRASAMADAATALLHLIGTEL